MIGRKTGNRYYVELNPAEVRTVITALMRFRNKCITHGKPTEDINEVILKLIK